ncbi:MAG: hypothetical protein JNK82_05275 [Myxococcaceae bacterium]|nr:hypothetical protein [Myxococcaceae bacterium]
MLELALALALLTGQTEEAAEAVAVPVDEEIDEPLQPSSGSSYDYAFANTQRQDVGGGATKVTALAQFPTPTYGYFPAIVHIDNTIGPRQTVRLQFQSQGGSGGTRTFSRSVDIAEGERRAVSIPVPAHLRYGNLRARAPGITEKGEAHIYFNNVSTRQRAVMNIGTAETFQQTVGAKPSYSGNANVQVVNLSREEAPGELTPYIGWDAVVLTGTKLEELSEAQRRALEAYAALGGHLVLMQNARGIASSFPLLAADTGHYGVGELTFCEKCGVQKVLGHTARVPVRAIEPRGRRNRYAYDEGNESVTELKLPVAVAPIGRFLLIITLFTLAIGPGSLWVARKKGPAALLVTIPGTAAFTCALIVGYSALRDGFTVHATLQGFTLLDSTSHRAVTATVGAFYANLAPGSSRFAADTVVVAPTTSRDYGSIDQGASVSWDEGAKFGADLIPSRSYVEWSILSASPTRARLVVKHDGSTVRAQNALGGELDYLQLRVGGKLYTLSSLKDGEEKEAKEAAAGAGGPQLGTLDKRISTEAKAALTAKLRDGEFIASMKGPGFTPLGGLQLEHTDSRHLVRGGYEK